MLNLNDHSLKGRQPSLKFFFSARGRPRVRDDILSVQLRCVSVVGRVEDKEEQLEVKEIL